MRLPRFTRVEAKAFDDGSPFISASFRGNHWIAAAYTRPAAENDIIAFIRNVKSLDCKISGKLIMPLMGIDANAKLLAKELRISIWDAATVNTLLGLYRKKRIVTL